MSVHEAPLPEWRRLYDCAIAETDDNLIRQRIAEAEDAIIQRSRELSKLGQFDGEDAELARAIIALYDLRRRVPERRMDRRSTRAEPNEQAQAED